MKKYKRKTIIKQLLKQGVHLWLILFLANVAIVYSFTFYSRASEEPAETQTIQARREKQPTPTPTIAPGGPVIDFSFDMPGIGSNGANYKPLHPTRVVTVSLYTPEHNVFDPKVDPLYTIQGQAIFDNNDKSPTYTRYLVNNFDLGKKVPDGTYQITLQTEQTLPLLLKDKQNTVGGTPYTLERSKRRRDSLPNQVMIIGDIAPVDGNGVMDINDYNTFVNCFGGKETELCPHKLLADFDDNGIIDGVDYNLLIRSYERLLKLGFPVPSVIISPTPRQVSRLSELSGTPAVTATPAATTKPAKGKNSVGSIIGILFLLMFVGGVAFILLKKKALLKDLQNKLFPKPQKEETETKTEDNQNVETKEKSEQQPQTTTETVEPQKEEQTQVQETATPEQPPEEVSQVPAHQAGEAIDSDFYVKKQNADTAGVWVTLTDDNGPTQGLYKGDNLHEGFCHVKGTFQEESGKKYIFITEITPTD